MRAGWWDYAGNGSYFVTICTKDRIHYFGTIQEGKMILSALGQAAYDCWEEIPKHYPYVAIDAFVIMPDHMHGILLVNRYEEPPKEISKSTAKREFKVQSGSLGAIIRGYKIGVTKRAKELNIDFKWHPNYHEHIFHTIEAYHNIVRYIHENPSKWKK